MANKFYFLMLLSLSFLDAEAQFEKYQNGYIVNLNMDTLRGQVKIVDFPVYIKYRDVNGKKEKLNPHKIMGFGQGHFDFESILIDDNKYFCQIIVKGEVSLYSYNVNGYLAAPIPPGMVLFFINSTKLFLKRNGQDKNIFLKKKHLNQQLSGFLKDNKQLSIELRDREVVFDELYEIILKYNNSYDISTEENPP